MTDRDMNQEGFEDEGADEEPQVQLPMPRLQFQQQAPGLGLPQQEPMLSFQQLPNRLQTAQPAYRQEQPHERRFMFTGPPPVLMKYYAELTGTA